MQKIYENFYIFHFQKKETICGNTVDYYFTPMLKPNYFKKQCFYFPKVIIQVQTGLEYSTG